MSTGIESWNVNLLDIGPMYPFAGTEVIWAVIGIGSWIIWHIVQGRLESRVLEKEEQAYHDKERLKRAMSLSNAETLNEEIRAHANGLKQGKIGACNTKWDGDCTRS